MVATAQNPAYDPSPGVRAKERKKSQEQQANPNVFDHMSPARKEGTKATEAPIREKNQKGNKRVPRMPIDAKRVTPAKISEKANIFPNCGRGL